MAKTGDLTVKILEQIRDEIVLTRTDLGGRIDRTNERIDQTNERLGVVESTLLELAEQQRFVVRGLRTLGQRDGRFDARLDELQGRVEVLEKRIG